MSESQTEDAIPTVQEKFAERSRMETFLEMSDIEARVERTVLIVLGEGVKVRIRKVVDAVKGAETFCGEMGTRCWKDILVVNRWRFR